MPPTPSVTVSPDAAEPFMSKPPRPSPGSLVAVAAHRTGDESRMGGRRARGDRAAALQGPPVRWLLTTTSAPGRGVRPSAHRPPGRVEVEVGAARADIGLGVDEFVLVVVRPRRAQHVGAVLGEGATDRRARDRMGERQHADVLERTPGGSERTRRPVAHPLDSDHGLRREERTLLVGAPLFGTPHHAHGQARRAGGVFEVVGVPRGDRPGHRGGVGRYPQEAAPLRRQVGRTPEAITHRPSAVP